MNQTAPIEEPLEASAAEELKTSFGACRADIAERIVSARSMSEEEVLAIGAAVNTIVDRAKAYVAQTEEQLRQQAESESNTSQMIKEMLAAVHAQEETVEKAITQSAAILSAGREMQTMASATRLLSLNARVEASRLGDQGSSFSVIADEMRQLSSAVQQTNSSVANMAKELERLLPQISEQTRLIQTQFERFSTHVDQQLGALRDVHTSEGDSPVVEQIMDAAYEALSHLAFQDPMVQSLERIYGVLDRFEAQLGRLQGGETIAASAPPPPPPPDDAPDVDIEAGDVLLF